MPELTQGQSNQPKCKWGGVVTYSYWDGIEWCQQHIFLAIDEKCWRYHKHDIKGV